MNRADFQQLADIRIADSGTLISQGQPDGGYYLAGYAVECGLKACIAKLTNQHDFPDKELATRSYTHDLEKLVKAANLEAQRKSDFDSSPNLAANWLIVKDWSEAARYDRKSTADAQQLFQAITDATDGVLPWIKRYW